MAEAKEPEGAPEGEPVFDTGGAAIAVALDEARTDPTLHNEVAAFLATLPADPGWEPDALALVVVALATGIALEQRVDPGTVPEGLPGRVLAALVGPGG